MKRASKKRGGDIDWSEVRTRLAEAQDRAAAVATSSPERIRAVLMERAQLLARAASPTRTEGATLELLVFALAAERYALEARHVREVARLQDFTPVPGAGDFIVGVTNLRGEVLCVVDLRKLLGVRVTGLTDLSRVLVLGGDVAELGILADSAHEIRGLSREDILSPPIATPSVVHECVMGVTHDALIVLDGEALLRDQRIFVDQSETASE